MTGPMPSLLPGYRRWTALASTCAAEWRITSSSDAEMSLPSWLICVEPPEVNKRPTVLGRGGVFSWFHPSSLSVLLAEVAERSCRADNGAQPWSATEATPFRRQAH